jgi:hypothetical protein
MIHQNGRWFHLLSCLIPERQASRGDGEVADRWFSTYNSGVAQGHNYSVPEVATLFSGMELVPPGLVEARRWRPGWPELPKMAPRRPGHLWRGPYH